MNASDIQQVGKWHVVRLIGQGGMSWVFEVIDPHLGARRALEMLKPAVANGAGYKGFWREARIPASLDDDCGVAFREFCQGAPEHARAMEVLDELRSNLRLARAFGRSGEGLGDYKQ
jgi:serine/threonine protein kinase